jgi:hypothetical protein
MTTTPTTFAETAADQLGRVLQAIHAHYADQVAPAITAAIDHRDFDQARQLCADSEYIANEVERIVKDFGGDPKDFGDGLGAVVMALLGTVEVDCVLEDIDPERLANVDRIIDGLRESGNWTDDDEAKHQLDTAERAANYPEVSL